MKEGKQGLQRGLLENRSMLYVLIWLDVIVTWHARAQTGKVF